MKKRLLRITTVILVLLVIFCLCTKTCKNESGIDVMHHQTTAEITNFVELEHLVVPDTLMGDTLVSKPIVHFSETVGKIVDLKESKPFVETENKIENVDTVIAISVIDTVVDTLVPVVAIAIQEFIEIDSCCVIDTSARFCNANIPGWNESLGIVSFASDRTWMIDTRIWSDAVTATNCDKTSFNTVCRSCENNLSYNADCRSNPDYPGDLFSWCAVFRFQDELCPAPWRVPTREDFISLNRTLRDTIVNFRPKNPEIRDKYLNDWGGVYGGGCFLGGRLYDQGTHALYWSQSENNPDHGYRLFFAENGVVYSAVGYFKRNGFALRCVR